MGEVKRKKPWENGDNQIENNMQNTFTMQLIFCLIITMGILITLNTQDNNDMRQTVKIELKKNIETKDVNAAIDYMKELAGELIN